MVVLLIRIIRMMIVLLTVFNMFAHMAHIDWSSRLSLAVATNASFVPVQVVMATMTIGIASRFSMNTG